MCPFSLYTSILLGDTLYDVRAAKHERLLLPSLRIPPPVFKAALELESLSEEKKVNAALAIMTRDDPSLSLDYDEVRGLQDVTMSGDTY
jgi:translation elongation factor EF-G